MEDVKTGRDGVYGTSDLYVAAWLLSNGLQVQEVDRRNPRRNDFILKAREDYHIPEKSNEISDKKPNALASGPGQGKENKEVTLQRDSYQ